MSFVRRLRPIRVSVGLTSVLLLAACQDAPTTPPSIPSSFDISEARFGSGNPDLFFGTPLAANPGADAFKHGADRFGQGQWRLPGAKPFQRDRELLHCRTGDGG